MDIKYDPAKAASNLKKHGVSFEEAATCLLDAMAVVREDPDARGEARFVALGMSHMGRLLAVVYALRDDGVRLISARKPTKTEAKSYA